MERTIEVFNKRTKESKIVNLDWEYDNQKYSAIPLSGQWIYTNIIKNEHFIFYNDVVNHIDGTENSWYPSDKYFLGMYKKNGKLYWCTLYNGGKSLVTFDIYKGTGMFLQQNQIMPVLKSENANAYL